MVKFNLYLTNGVRSILILFLFISLNSIGQITLDSTSIIKELSDNSSIVELKSDSLYPELLIHNLNLKEKSLVKRDSTSSKGHLFNQTKDKLKVKNKKLKTFKNDSIAYTKGDSLKQTTKEKLGMKNRDLQILKKDTTGRRSDSLKQIAKGKIGIKDEKLQIFKKDTTGHKGDSLKQNAKERLGIKDKNLEIFKKDTTGHKRDSLKQIAKGKFGIKDKDLNMFKKDTTGHRRDSLKQIAKGKLGINDKNLQIFKKDTTGHRRDSLKQLAKEKLGINKYLQMFKRDTTGHRRDSLKKIAKEKLGVKKKDVKIHMNISNQFDYGTVPYYLENFSSPASAFKSQGDVKFSVKSIPLMLNYFYANPAGLFGVQNYYTLRFDKEAFEQNIRNECLNKKTVYQEKLKGVQKLKQEYGQKLAFCESMQNYTNTALPATPNLKVDSSMLKTNVPDINMPDTVGLTNHPTMSKKDSLKYKEDAYLDSLLANFNADNNLQQIKEYKEKIEMYEELSKDYEQAIKLLDSNQLDGMVNPYVSKAKNFLGHIKNLEIGMCYPNYSSFLINNLTLKGINVGYETKNYFVNATYGKTINNFLIPRTNNPIINTFQNYSNFFDFNRTQDTRKILAGKIGIGDVGRSYLAFGALYGVGNQSYYQPTNTKEKNFVYEVDGKITYKGYALYGSFAKSFLRSENSNEEQNVLSRQRNNGLQLRFTGSIPYLKTKFSLGYRLVDPFFKSYGAGFLRTDNIRYEVKLDQNITSKFKVGVNYRHDQDNILNRYGFKSNLHFISMSAKAKFFRKRLDVQLIYTPIIHKIENITTHLTTKNISDMKNVVIAYTPKLKKMTVTFTGLYSQYTLYNDVSLRNMENINLNIITIFKNSLKFGVSSGYFNSNVRDSVSTPRTLINSFETGYTFRKNIFTSLILKHSYNFSSYNHQYGAAGNVNFPLIKGFSIDLHAEKLIVGDFYNSLNLESVEKFPYYCYIKLNLKF